jgi:hypothetical protein
MPPAVHAPTILPNQKTSTPTAGMVERYVKTEVALLAHPDPAVQKEARKRIDDALAAPIGSPNTSPEYQTEFAKHLNAALLPLFKNPDMRIRLNAAIVLQHAAERLDNVLLSPAATAAISDPALPVVIWGVKAARSLVVGNLDLLPAMRNTALLDGVLSAVKRFPTSGALAEDAYEDFAGAAVMSPDKKDRAAAAVPYVLALMNSRVDAYRQVTVTPGGDPPELPGSPTADVKGVTFLSTQNAWDGAAKMPTDASKPNGRQQVGRVLMDLGAEMGRLAPALPLRAGVNEEGTHKEDAIDVIKIVGQAGQVLAARERNANLKKFADAVYNISAQTADDDLKDRLTALETGLKDAKLLAPPRPPPGASAVTDVPVAGTTVAAPASARPTAAAATPAARAPK